MAQDRVELVNGRTQVRGHGPIGGFSVDQKHSITEKDQTIHLSIDDIKAIAKFAGLTVVEQGTVQEFADSLKA